ncbi:protein phosphatase 2C family protein isoform X3 [Wolffia australiana]
MADIPLICATIVDPRALSSSPAKIVARSQLATWQPLAQKKLRLAPRNCVEASTSSLELVSADVCKDGSVVFRFGTAEEVEEFELREEIEREVDSKAYFGVMMSGDDRLGEEISTSGHDEGSFSIGGEDACINVGLLVMSAQLEQEFPSQGTDESELSGSGEEHKTISCSSAIENPEVEGLSMEEVDKEIVFLSDVGATEISPELERDDSEEDIHEATLNRQVKPDDETLSIAGDEIIGSYDLQDNSMVSGNNVSHDVEVHQEPRTGEEGILEAASDQNELKLEDESESKAETLIEIQTGEEGIHEAALDQHGVKPEGESELIREPSILGSYDLQDVSEVSGNTVSVNVEVHQEPRTGEEGIYEAASDRREAIQEDESELKAENLIEGSDGLHDISVVSGNNDFDDVDIHHVPQTGEETIQEAALDQHEVELSEGAQKDYRCDKSDDDVAALEAMPSSSIGLQSKSVETTSTQARYILQSGAAMLPHPSKALTGGEDAYFLAHKEWLGVADGVGQWSFEGINAGLFARELMNNCKRLVPEHQGNPAVHPAEILSQSCMKCLSPGSSTALVAFFDGQGLHVANIGDSGFIVIRNNKVLQRSAPMVFAFNFPYQIEAGENPSQLIQSYEVKLDEGDVVVTATDGLFDNLYEAEISEIISQSQESGSTPMEMAEKLAVKAHEIGKSEAGRSPFADAAHTAGYKTFSGGKLDDVTVVVSLVRRP